MKNRHLGRGTPSRMSRAVSMLLPGRPRLGSSRRWAPGAGAAVADASIFAGTAAPEQQNDCSGEDLVDA